MLPVSASTVTYSGNSALPTTVPENSNKAVTAAAAVLLNSSNPSASSAASSTQPITASANTAVAASLATVGPATLNTAAATTKPIAPINWEDDYLKIMTNAVKRKKEEEGDDRPEDTVAHAFLISVCLKKNKSVLQGGFPNRSQYISEEQVHRLTCDELVNLSAGKFFTIVDMLSEEQAIGLLKIQNKDLHERKMALLNFNDNVCKTYLKLFEKHFKLPDPALVEVADKFLKPLKKFSPEEMTKLANFDLLDQERMKLSETLKKSEISCQRWKSVNDELIEGLKMELTLEIIKDYNDYLRPEKSAPSGYRSFIPGAQTGENGIFYVPQRLVHSLMVKYLEWFKASKLACEKGANPLIFAAMNMQLFVLIHPFLDGNGRTGRFFTDALLRSFGLLPVAWPGEVNAPQLYYLEGQKEHTATVALQMLLDGLERSYKIVGSAASSSAATSAANPSPSTAETNVPEPITSENLASTQPDNAPLSSKTSTSFWSAFQEAIAKEKNDQPPS